MNLKQCVQSFLNSISGFTHRKLFDLSCVEICDATYKTSNEPPRDSWRNYDPNIPLVGKDVHFWLRASFHTPTLQNENEFLILRTRTGRDQSWDASNPQGLLYLNGQMVQGLDANHTDAFLEPDTAYELHNYFYIGTEKRGASQCKMTLYAVRRDVEQLYYDVKVPFDTCAMLPEDSLEYARMMSTLVDAVRLVDLRDPGSERFYESVGTAIDFMEKEFYSKLCTPEGKPILHCIGHTHIDVEWKWTRAQTREKMQRSFATAKALMDRYPEYKFMLSQPELYRYLKEEAPEKYEELKELVRDGRWEAEGAMYLEPDCNLTSGESLVRQIVFGKRFFREEFGVESKILFLPDVFGYSAALPQILKKSGIDYFVTSKISWNDTNTMPCDIFYWEGIDGSEIFTSFITAQHFGGIPGMNGKNRTTYVGHITPSFAKGTWDRFHQKEYVNRTLMTYGYGDGGGGPTREMLEIQRRTARGIPSLPVTKTDTLRAYLEEVKKEFDASCRRTGRNVRWVGELYLEYHRGTFTSMAKNKKNNRESELLLGCVEAISATDLYFGGSYDDVGINRCWRKLLHNQFHDILPGSSIKEVYDGTDKDYAEVASYGHTQIAQKLNSLKSRIGSRGGILLYNPTGFEKAAYTSTGAYVEYNCTVPAFGYAVISGNGIENRVKLDVLRAENDYYILTLNELGQIESLYDKKNCRNVLKGTGNVLVAFEDNPTKYDAWEIDNYYSLKSYVIDTPAEITNVTDGTRAGFIIERKYMHSTLRQTIWLYSKNRRIDFENEIDWNEHHQLIKAIFPIDVHASTATHEIQFGHVTRPTHENTSWDSAKFETYAHKWVDVAENGYGVALLNNAKYGHSVLGSTVGISLLKCASFPNTKADEGHHSFTYSLFPHADDFRRGGVIEESIALNQPFYETCIEEKTGELPERFSFVSTDSPNAVITAVKRADRDDGLIVRFHDAYDCRSKVTLKLPDGFKKAYLCDLTENEKEELALDGGRVTLPVSNFEIVTLKFTK